MGARFIHTIGQFGGFPPPHIIHCQCDVLSPGQTEPDTRHRIERIGIIPVQQEPIGARPLPVADACDIRNPVSEKSVIPVDTVEDRGTEGDIILDLSGDENTAGGAGANTIRVIESGSPPR